MVSIPSSSESEGSDVDEVEELIDKDNDEATISAPKIEDEKKSASMTPKEEVLQCSFLSVMINF